MQGNPTPTPETIGAQRADADLAAIAALSTTGLIERTGAGTASTTTVSAFAKTILDDADASTARGTLQLGTLATQSAASVAITGGTIAGITDLAIADGGTGASTAENARTNLGATTVGSNLFTLPNPSAITFPRLNADNSVSALNAADFRTAISAQALDSDLEALAALATTGLIDRTGAGTATTRTTGTTGLNVLAAANEAAARAAIGAMANTAPEITTNANGTAYRWPNGLQICTGNGIAQATNLPYGSLWAAEPVATWTYPAAFAATPVAIGSVMGTTGRWINFDPYVNTLNYAQYSFSSQSFFLTSKLLAIGTYT
jgi:hypothetical protein